VANALQSGEKIRAVSLYARSRGCTLREAREAIDKVERDNRSSESIQST
jgi:hypothetical protein